MNDPLKRMLQIENKFNKSWPRPFWESFRCITQHASTRWLLCTRLCIVIFLLHYIMWSVLHYVHYIVFHIISDYVEFNLDHLPPFTPTTKFNLLCKRDQCKHENLKCVRKIAVGLIHHCGLIRYKKKRKKILKTSSQAPEWTVQMWGFKWRWPPCVSRYHNHCFV